MSNKTSQHILGTSANLIGFCLFIITSLHLTKKMKKLILLLNSFLLLNSVSSSGQTICDSISVDTAYMDINMLQLQVYNSSQHFIVYPYFIVILNTNPYILLNDTFYVPSFLSVPGDANLGYTSASYLGTVTPPASIPFNTVFTGTLTINDPNDSTFTCSKPFSFTYGTLNTSVNELNTSLLKIYPNPSSRFFTIFFPQDDFEITVTNMIGKQIIKTRQTTTNLQVEESGVYIVSVKTKQGTITQKLIAY